MKVIYWVVSRNCVRDINPVQDRQFSRQREKTIQVKIFKNGSLDFYVLLSGNKTIVKEPSKLTNWFIRHLKTKKINSKHKVRNIMNESFKEICTGNIILKKGNRDSSQVTTTFLLNWQDDVYFQIEDQLNEFFQRKKIGKYQRR